MQKQNLQLWILYKVGRTIKLKDVGEKKSGNNTFSFQSAIKLLGAPDQNISLYSITAVQFHYKASPVPSLHPYIQQRHFCFWNVSHFCFGTTLQSMDSFSGGSIYVFLYRTLIHRSPEELPKNFWNSTNVEHTCPSPLSKTITDRNTGWKERRWRVTWLLSPKISQKWTLFFLCKKKNTKTLKAFRRLNILLMLHSQLAFVFINFLAHKSFFKHVFLGSRNAKISGRLVT